MTRLGAQPDTDRMVRQKKTSTTNAPAIARTLTAADLNRADLSIADLSIADLSTADLSTADSP